MSANEPLNNTKNNELKFEFDSVTTEQGEFVGEYDKEKKIFGKGRLIYKNNEVSEIKATWNSSDITKHYTRTTV